MEKFKKYALMLVVIFLLNVTSPTIKAIAIDNDTLSHVVEGSEMKVDEESLGGVPKDVNDSEMVSTERQEDIGNNQAEKADEILLPIVSKIENPIDNQKLTGDFFIKGFAVSVEGISKVDVYIDEVINGRATYGISRKDIGDKYSNYPNADKSGFTYKVTNIPDGNHTVKIVVTDIKGDVQEQSTTIVVDNTKTIIMGKGTLDRNQMIKKLRDNNKKGLSLKYISDFVDYTIVEANTEGVNYDILFSQMMHETGYLNFGGDVKPEQNNFAGIGATGNGVPGNSFPTVQIGIRAVVQHLKAYASTEPLKQTCVDPRFNYVARGSALYVEHLGIQENPDGKGWAAARGYGYNLLKVRTTIASISSTLDFSVLNSVNVNGKLLTDNILTVTADATPTNDTLYKIIVQYGNNNEIILSDWSSRNTVSYTPSKSGKYKFMVYAKHKNSTSGTQSDVIYKEVTVDAGKSKVTSLNVTGSTFVGSTLTMKATAEPAENTLYKLWVCDRSTDTWTVLSDYSNKNSVDFKPIKSGDYSFVVHVKHKESSGKDEDDYRAVDVNVTAPKSKVTSLNVTGGTYVGSTLTMSAAAEPAADTLYKLWVCDRSTDTWTVLSDYSTKSSVNFTPVKAGNYTFTVHVKHKGSNGKDEDDYRGVDVNVTAPKSKVTSLNVTGSASVGSVLTMSATAEPAADTLYKLWVCDRSTDTWTVLSDYSTKSSVEFTPTKASKYSFVVHVKHKGSNGKEEDDYKSVDINVSGESQKSRVTSLNVTGNRFIGSTLTMSAAAEPAADTLYKLWVCDRSTDTWTVLSDYSAKSSIEYKPQKIGKYSFVVHVKHKSSNGKDEDDYRSVDVNITDTKSSVTSLKVTGSASVGSTLTMSATAEPAQDTLYKLWVTDRSTGTWTVLSDYSTTSSVDFTPTKGGKYSFVVHVKHKASTGKEEDDYQAVDVFVKGDTLIVIDPGHNQGGDSGAVASHNGITYSETELNMQIASKLKSELERRGYQVAMTRNPGEIDTSNVSDSLKRRVDYANNLNADLFISIHHNAYSSSSANGVEVYYSSATPGSRGLLVGDGLQLSAESKSSIINPRNAGKVSASKTLATSMVNNLASRIGYYNRGAKDNSFYVVKNTTMPSVLVENGFITNSSDAQKAADPATQQKIAEALADSVSKQF
ncbi:MAG: N-acetylmuramoyl-L-alanine amidase [Clostridium sp.]